MNLMLLILLCFSINLFAMESSEQEGIIQKVVNAINPIPSAQANPIKIIKSLSAYNRAQHEQYKKGLRKVMEKPHVEDQKLQKIVDKLYKPNGEVGNGSTQAAIREELGNPSKKIKGKVWSHVEKGRRALKELEKWQNENSTARPGDRAAAENVITDLKDALYNNNLRVKNANISQPNYSFNTQPSVTFKDAQPSITFNSKPFNLTISVPNPSPKDSSGWNLNYQKPQFEGNVKVTYQLIQSDPAADLLQSIKQQDYEIEKQRLLEERDRDWASMKLLWNNHINAYETMSNCPDQIYQQLLNLQAMGSLIVDFCNRPESKPWQQEVDKMAKQWDIIRQNLHHKMNWFVNLPIRKNPCNFYMHKWALPAAKKAFGGQNPKDKKLFSLELAAHWKMIYNVANNNTKAAFENFKALHNQGQLTAPVIKNYITGLHPQATEDDIQKFCENLQQ